MTFEACLLAVKKAAPDLTDRETDELLGMLSENRDRRVADGRARDLAQATRQAAEELTNQMKEARLIKRREQLLNDDKVRQIAAYVKREFDDNPAEGIEAKMMGVAKNREGARDGAAQMQRALENEYFGGLIYDLEAAGLKKLFTSNAMEQDVARALWALDQGKKIDVAPEAQKLAEIIRKWQEKTRLDQNKEGAWIGNLEDYITRQSHDYTLIRKAGGLALKADDPGHFHAWRDYIRPLLDQNRVRTDDDFLKEVYNGLVSGDHLKTGDDASGAFTGPRNIAKSVSAERVLHFKDADSWLSYNERFGMGSLSESVTRSLDYAAQNAGLMRTFGTNPRAVLARVADDIAAGLRDTPNKLRAFNEEIKRLERKMSYLDGTTAVAENATLAEWSSAARVFQNMTKLPMMLLSQFSDLATFASDVKFATGKSWLGGIQDAVVGLGVDMPPAERAKMMSQIGVFADGMINDIQSKFGGNDPVSGKMADMQQKFFSLVGARWWTERMRRRAAESYSHALGLEKDKAFGELDSSMQRAMRLYSIGEKEWDAIRANVRFFNERSFAVSEGLPDAVGRKFRSFLADRVDYAVLQPGAKTNYYMMWGTDIKRGTAAGEALRFIMQFKSYPIAFAERVLGREVYGRGANTLGEALTNKNGELVGLAQMVLWTTAFGYLSLTAKELAKGKEPRDVTDPEVAWKTFMASAAKGGGLGIYSDFLFGEAKRGGRGTAETLLGPTISDFANITDMFQRAIRGEDVKSDALRTAIQMAAGRNPYASVVVNGYPRIALDYLILYRIQEEISPGYMRRMERRMEKENAQEFMFAPSQYAN